MMESRSVIVTYSDEYGIWTSIAENLAQQFPLRDLVWKPSNNLATRQIPVLDVDLKRFSPEAAKNLPPVTLLQNPYLNIYFVNCEDTEIYRTTVRQQIREWLQNITSKKNQEWLIVHISSQEVRNATKFLRSSVLDRIKADFNTGKRDRVTQLRMADTEMSERELWADFTTKVKEGILTSFDQNVMSFEEDVRRLDSQRQMPGWNYCTFFILKEGLAHAFEMMNLHEEALRQYDELEASFFQILRDNALTWHGKFGGMDEGDDASNLLDLSRKPYRDQILQNTITVFDFRTYLFGRQCHLLFKLYRPAELCRRAVVFIPMFARTVREHVHNLTQNFLESWIYTACMSITNACEEAVPLPSDGPHAMVLLDGAKAELLQLARQQLDKLGIKHGRIPKELPFTMSLGYDDVFEPEETEGVERRPMNPELQEAVSTDESFDTLYMSVSARAIKGYDGSGRHRSSLLLHGDVAALQLYRKKFAEAARILESITWRYGQSRWTVLENELVIKYAMCLKELGDTFKYANACLTLLRNMNDLKQEDLEHYAKELFATVVTKELDQDMYHEFAPMFSVKVVSAVEILHDDDGSFVDVEIDNKLPLTIDINKLSLRMVSGEVDELWFSARRLTLQPGKNTFRVICETSASGSYVLEKVHLKVGKLVFLYDFLQESRKRIFRVDSHPQALKAVILPPREVTLGQMSKFVVSISSGRNQVAEAALALFPASEGLEFAEVSSLAYIKYPGGGSEDEVPTTGEIQLDTFDNILLPAFGPNETLTLTIPYESMLAADEHQVKLIVQYITPNSRRHTFSLTSNISTLLPLQISNSIVWRDDCMHMRIDMTCTGSIPVRVFDVEFLHPECIKEWKQPPLSSELTLFPRQHASFVFKVARPKDDAAAAQRAVQAHFVVTYQSLREEVKKALTHIVGEELEKAQLQQHGQFVAQHLKGHLLKSVDFMAYGMSDELELPPLDVAFCENIFAYHDAKVRESLISILKDLFSAKTKLEYDQIMAINGQLQPFKISFPIHLPTSQVLTTVELRVNKTEDLMVGSPVMFGLTIKHSDYWSSNDGAATTTVKDANEFFYDIQIDYENWLLCGHKKRMFMARPGDSTTHSVSMIPLKTGPLHLPKITVSSLQPNVFNQTAYMNEAEQVLVKPRTRTSTFFIDQQRSVHYTPHQHDDFDVDR